MKEKKLRPFSSRKQLQNFVNNYILTTPPAPHFFFVNTKLSGFLFLFFGSVIFFFSLIQLSLKLLFRYENLTKPFDIVIFRKLFVSTFTFDLM